MASASEDASFKVWDVKTGRQSKTHRSHVMYSVSWCPDGKRLVTGGVAVGSSIGTVQVWDAIRSEDPHLLQGHSHAVDSVCWSPDNSRMASASQDTTVKIWDADTSQLLHTLPDHTSAVTSVCFSPSGEKLVSASEDGTALSGTRTRANWDAH